LGEKGGKAMKKLACSDKSSKAMDEGIFMSRSVIKGEGDMGLKTEGSSECAFMQMGFCTSRNILLIYILEKQCLFAT